MKTVGKFQNYESLSSWKKSMNHSRFLATFTTSKRKLILMFLDKKTTQFYSFFSAANFCKYAR